MDSEAIEALGGASSLMDAVLKVHYFSILFALIDDGKMLFANVMDARMRPRLLLSIDRLSWIMSRMLGIMTARRRCCGQQMQRTGTRR